jgi:GT2 family glycosyltransferase
LEHVIAMDADYFFSLDSDIVLPNGCLQQLLDYMHAGHPGIVAPAVNMALNARAMNVMRWADRNRPGIVNGNRNLPDGPNDVVMAAMLLDREGMRCRWSHNIGGEDIGFCLDAVEKNVPRWWLSSVRCQHMMTPVS